MSGPEDAALTDFLARMPWAPHCPIRGNLAIGNLRENLLQAMSTERGIHAETLMAAIGALAGFAAQNAALDRAAAVTLAGESLEQYSVILVDTKTGERHLVGEWINEPLFESRGDGSFPLWGFIAAAAQDGGAALDRLADIREMAGHVAGSLGGPDYGKLRAPAGHTPGMQPNDLLAHLWPLLGQIIRLPAPQSIEEREPPLSEMHWPVIISIVAGQYLRMIKDVLAPQIAFALCMESAVISSKLDPERIEPGKWELQPVAGRLTVRRLRS